MSTGLQPLLTLIFGFGMFVYWTMAFFLLYNLIRFGVGALPRRIAALFLGGSLFLSLIAILLFNQINVPGATDALRSGIQNMQNVPAGSAK